MDIIKKNFARLLDLIFPRQCVVCGKNGAYLCGTCAFGYGKKLDERAVYKLVELLKYKFSTEIAGILGRILYERHADFLKKAAAEKAAAANDGTANMDTHDKSWAITFVPIHRKRFLFRGFNQARLIAEAVARETGMAVEEYLIKTRHTRPQVGLKREERLKNLIDAFSIKPGAALAKNIILIDDVLTTGATLRECAKVLKSGGAEKIIELVLCKKH